MQPLLVCSMHVSTRILQVRSEASSDTSRLSVPQSTHCMYGIHALLYILPRGLISPQLQQHRKSSTSHQERDFSEAAD